MKNHYTNYELATIREIRHQCWLFWLVSKKTIQHSWSLWSENNYGTPWARSDEWRVNKYITDLLAIKLDET